MVTKRRDLTFIGNYYRQKKGELGFIPVNQFGDMRIREGLQLGAAYSRSLGKRYSADAYARYAYSIHQYGITNSEPIPKSYSNGYSFNSRIRMGYRSKKTPASVDIQFIREGAHNLFKPAPHRISGLFAGWDIPGKNEVAFNELSVAAHAGYNLSHFWGIFGGIRYVHTGAGSKNIFSPLLKVVYDPLAPLHITLSYDHGYRSPSILERRIKIENMFYSTGSLHPEQIHAINLSLDYDLLKSVHFQMSVYRQAVNNLIIQKQVNSSTLYNVTNSQNEYQIDGLNLNTTYQPNSKIYLFLDGVFHRITEKTTQNKIFNYPRMNAKTGFGYRVNSRFEGLFHLNFIGKQNLDNPVNSIDPFFLINFSLSMKLMENVNIKLVANNLLNEKCYFMNYVETNSLLIPGEFPRALFIQLRARF
jgi:outer membrane receptor protein involved in Fe transport